MKRILLFLCSLSFALNAAAFARAEEIEGTWHAQFETFSGLQTYHFTFGIKDDQPSPRPLLSRMMRNAKSRLSM